MLAKKRSIRNRNSFVLFFLIAFPCLGFSQVINNWEMALHGGLSTISGDVLPLPGIGGGISVKRNLSKNFGLRLDYTGSVNKGQDISTRTSVGINDNALYDPWFFSYSRVNNPFVANFRSAIHQFSANGVINLFNINAPTSQNKINIYGTLGYSYIIADIDVNAVDGALQPYNFNDPTINYNAGKKALRNQLKQLMDNRYEHNAYFGDPKNNSKNFHHYHGINAGVGIGYSLTQNLGLAIEHKITATFTDYLDGIKSGGNDRINYTSIRLTYNIGNRLTKPARRVHSDGSKTIVTGMESISTMSGFVEAKVRGEAKASTSDTTYKLLFTFVPTVPGNVTRQQMVYIKLENKEVVMIPFFGEDAPLKTGTAFNYTTRLTRQQVVALSQAKATDIKIETSGFALEDTLKESSQSAIANICKQLLRL